MKIARCFSLCPSCDACWKTAVSAGSFLAIPSAHSEDKKMTTVFAEAQEVPDVAAPEALGVVDCSLPKQSVLQREIY